MTVQVRGRQNRRQEVDKEFWKIVDREFNPFEQTEDEFWGTVDVLGGYGQETYEGGE